MLSENDRQLLLRNLNSNEVVLVTGAGFSLACKNIFDQNLPDSKRLAKLLWSFLYDDPYDGTSTLKTLYGAARNHRKGMRALRSFLRQHLYATEIPGWYQLIQLWHWYRIYTFNADNVMEQIYPEDALSCIVAPAPFSERDQFLHRTQYVKLHGSLDDDKDLVFGPKEYGARAALKVDMWYQHFVEDYSTKCVLFVGTELDEQLFYQHIESRGDLFANGDKVRLPKCFLIKPTIAKPLIDQLEKYRIVPVPHTAEDFFTWLLEQQKPLSREEILRSTHPDWEIALEAAEHHEPRKQVKVIEKFLSIFHLVKRPTPIKASSRSHLFLLGSPPTWEDIAANMDADREVNGDFRTLLNLAVDTEEIDIVRVSSPAGGGKSTVMRRGAISLADDGYRVYFSDATERPDADAIVSYVLSLREKVILFFDNCGPDVPEIADAWMRLKSFEFRPIFILAARSNDFANNAHQFERFGAKAADLFVPDLTEHDILSVIKVLDTHDLLGKLKDKTLSEQVSSFQEKSRSQILVAMREATSGNGFDEILRHEFADLNTDDAKLLYLIAALASDDDFGLTREFIIAAMQDSPSATVSLIDNSLRGILVPQGKYPLTYSIRHPAIAHFIIDSAQRDKLADAIIALMVALWGVLPEGRSKKLARPFRLYKKLLNHSYIQASFSSRKLARGIYEAITPYYRDDGHFWLQYASYEIEGGDDIVLAENYLNQAEALLGEKSRQVQTARAHLLFLKAQKAPNSSSAKNYVDEALILLRAHMAQSARVSWHALHIFGDQMHAYVWKWVPTIERSKHFGAAYEELRRAIPEGMKDHKLLQSTLSTLKRAELETVVRGR